MQGRAPRGTARLPTEIQSFSASVKKAYSLTFYVNDIQKLKLRAEENLERKFELTSMDKIEAVDILNVVYNLSIRIEEFANALRSYDMIDIFSIPDDFTYNTVEDVYESYVEATPIDLFGII